MSPQLAAALERIDEANREDPNELTAAGSRGPRSMIEGRLASEWVRRLRPDAPDELVLAARAHHLRRWTVPRTDFPAGRAGYLRWRRHLYEEQGRHAVDVLAGAGYADTSLARVAELVAKRGLARDPGDRDPDAQTLEDAVCLVFLETQLEDFAEGRPDDDVVEIITKTWAKMSDVGRAAAVELDLPARAAALVRRALTR